MLSTKKQSNKIIVVAVQSGRSCIMAMQIFIADTSRQ